MTKKNHTPFRLVLVLLITAVLFSLPGISFAADWPCWRGPNGDGISAETNWNPKALDNPKIAWRAQVGKGHSSLSVKGNYLYTMGNKVSKSGGTDVYFDTVYCLDNRTGKEVWQYSYPCRNTNYPGPRTTPAVDGNYVYTLSWEGHLFCFDAKTGSVVWKRHLVDENLSRRPGWGFSGSPVVDGDLLILTAAKSGIALDKRTGKVIWKSESAQCSLPSPVLFNSAGKRLAAIPNGSKLYAVDVKTGKIQWEQSRDSNMDIDPILFGDKMLIQGNRNSTLVNVGGAQPKVVKEFNNMRFNPFLNFVVIDGYVYGFHNDRRSDNLSCLDLNTGELKWQQDMGQNGALIAAGRKLIVLKGDGTMLVAEASPDAYKMISSAKVLKMAANTGGRPQDMCSCWTIPAIADGKVYARNNYGEVVCVDMKM